ncbi:hydroxymethylglutaryl-CoA synthase [Levilactobacillus zymae]|uniref:Hydroxymethylglutaryl-CoA synthase n=1 Tax=Levilactobacillus zymae TaxID=267363 RepID=A0ABQ0WT68_9LACO|nr:hydroxymethylglutaryl-CoA synthase [Levilactobacillus zymae]KRL15488.1 3-hydroxy-3-methylglutaryl-CoA synthase [Levilactobacillus zymae DSM 19395]QFR60844.1 hydroxymethylglutaryl-CoA synthase [Levilactobacillus zymae]GEO71065.1 hydroxymethylglutaryl-CoA synthase [Levilactobacillus zymae]
MTVTVGIDRLGFYTPQLYLDMTALALARGEDPAKYHVGIGQDKQAVIPPTQDVVTMAANAATQILTPADLADVKMVLFGTESGIDNSKATAVYLAHLLGLAPDTRAVELKQACYGATAGLQLAADYVRARPAAKVLVIGADIARYGLRTAGEVTQGGGAVAMLVTADPQIFALDPISTYHTADVMDFWRPLDRTEALVDGKYSTNVYLDFFKETWTAYQHQTGRTIADFAAMVFHLPFTKMGRKGLRQVLPEATAAHQQELTAAFEASQLDNRNVGNLYTGSLYLSLLSLLRHGALRAGDRLGCFSYGSGAEGEFYSGTVQPDYRRGFDDAALTAMLTNRRAVSVAEYESIFQQQLPNDGRDVQLPVGTDTAPFYLAGRQHQQRQYRRR